MNQLSQYLVEELLKESEKITDYVVVYSGRFQPFHKGHYATYEHLVKKFGKNNVFIGTSDKTDNQKSPFNFKEKKTIMTKMFGIPSNKIVQVKNPYAPTEILKNFDDTTTGFITVVGEKDEQRLGGKYFDPYKGKIEFGYKDKGYVYASPAQPNPISGTDVRNWLSKGSDEEKRNNFLKAYPKFDETIYKFITLKLAKLGEGLRESINEAKWEEDRS
jgi:cytidyltransferase-like protein